jgi:RNA polymerase sigma-70 factor (ECF subfamily)
MGSDRALVDQVLKDDTAAYETLYARYEGAVRRQLLRTIRDDTAAEDLVQEVFLRLWTRSAQ